MEKSKKPAKDVGDVILVIEVAQKPSGEKSGVTVFASIPNREGTIVRRWGNPGGIPDAKQIEDLTAWIENMVVNSLLMTIGVQVVLPLA